MNPFTFSQSQRARADELEIRYVLISLYFLFYCFMACRKMRGISIIEMRFECAVSRIEQHFFRISFAANLFSDDEFHQKLVCNVCVCARRTRLSGIQVSKNIQKDNKNGE